MRKACISALHLFTVLCFLMAGVAFVAIRCLPQTRLKVADFFLVHYEQCSLIALGCFFTALILTCSFYLLEQGRFFVVRMGVSIDLDVVRRVVEECCVNEFQRKISLTDVLIGEGSRLEVGVSFASLSEQERSEMFPIVEKKLSTLLAKRFGYRKPFDLVAKI